MKPHDNRTPCKNQNIAGTSRKTCNLMISGSGENYELSMTSPSQHHKRRASLTANSRPSRPCRCLAGQSASRPHRSGIQSGIFASFACFCFNSSLEQKHAKDAKICGCGTGDVQWRPIRVKRGFILECPVRNSELIPLLGRVVANSVSCQSTGPSLAFSPQYLVPFNASIHHSIRITSCRQCVLARTYSPL